MDDQNEKPFGRPTKYDPRFVPIAAQMCKMGATDADLAAAFEVSISTVKLWAVQHEDFSAAIKLNKELANDWVEKSLYERAKGYSCDEVDIRVVEGQIVKTPIVKHYPPDTASMIFWLKNRRPDLWREKQKDEDADKALHIHLHKGDEGL